MGNQQNRGGVLIALFWIASLVLGALHQSPWLLMIPPMVLLIERALTVWQMGARMRATGVDSTAAFYGYMTFPTIILALWNGGICAVLFLAAWLVASLVT